MSINQIIKQNLSGITQRLEKANNSFNYCQNMTFHNCSNCKELKSKRCCARLKLYKKIKMSDKRWHLYFICENQHKVIRWVNVEKETVIVGKIHN